MLATKAVIIKGQKKMLCDVLIKAIPRTQLHASLLSALTYKWEPEVDIYSNRAK